MIHGVRRGATSHKKPRFRHPLDTPRAASYDSEEGGGFRLQHDAFFKSLLKAFLKEFIELFYPDKAAQLDFSHVEFLDKETFTDLGRGEVKDLDIVAKVRTRDGGCEVVLIHVEVEARTRRGFEARMYDYYQTLRLRHRCPVLPIALFLSGGAVGLERPVHHDRTLGEEVCDFRFWRVSLKRLHGAEYVGKRNPLAAGLAALMTPGMPARWEWKVACWKAVAHARVDAARRTLLADCLEGYLPLDARDAERFERTLAAEENTEVQEMRKTWSQQLMEKGEERGRKIGEERGRAEAKRETLLTLMRAKFGALPPVVARKVSAIENLRRLDTLLRRILTATSVAEMNL